MIIRLLLVILLSGVVSAQIGNACSTMDDCNKVYYLCHNNVCGHCSSTKPCSPAHTVRTICDSTTYSSVRCIQCSSNAGCSGGKKCVTNKQVYLCADTCTDPTSPCTATSQCIYIANDNGSGGGFYCLSCENSADCRKWSGSLSSTCSSGKCSPAFVSCGQHSDCRSLTASYCNGDNVCKPCTSNSHCNRFTATPICNSGTCVQCNGHSDCPAIETAQCLSNTCVPCTANTHCSRFSATPVCKTSEGKCVKCVEHSDCNSASASQCSASNTCITCSDPSHCAHITSKPYCGTPSNPGVCVQCQANLDCDSASASRCSSAGTCSSCNDSDQCEHITGSLSAKLRVDQDNASNVLLIQIVLLLQRPDVQATLVSHAMQTINVLILLLSARILVHQECVFNVCITQTVSLPQHHNVKEAPIPVLLARNRVTAHTYHRQVYARIRKRQVLAFNASLIQIVQMLQQLNAQQAIHVLHAQRIIIVLICLRNLSVRIQQQQEDVFNVLKMRIAHTHQQIVSRIPIVVWDAEVILIALVFLQLLCVRLQVQAQEYASNAFHTRTVLVRQQHNVHWAPIPVAHAQQTLHVLILQIHLYVRILEKQELVYNVLLMQIVPLLLQLNAQEVIRVSHVQIPISVHI